MAAQNPASDEDSSWTSGNEEEEEDDGVIRALLVEQLEEYDPRIFNIDFTDLSDLKRIGGGNFGQVWKANYFGTKVAVKQLLDVDDADMHKYITREMLTLRDVRHPNVVQLMGLCKHSSGIYIVTEYIPGGHLRKLLKSREIELPWVLRLRIAIDIVMALTYLHSRGIVHRDLKSQNLLVDEGYRIKVCDFGFSRIVEKNEYMTVCGTDEWMAPEVRLGKMYDERADVFSFAMVLTELITRNKPVERLPGRQFAFDTLSFRRTAPADCPKALIDLTCAMAHSNPAERMGFKDGLKVLKSLKRELEEAVAPPKEPRVLRQSQAFELSTMRVAMAEESRAYAAAHGGQAVLASPASFGFSATSSSSGPASMASSSSSPASSSSYPVTASASAGTGGLLLSPTSDGTATLGRVYRARTEYQASHESELTIKQGDVVVIQNNGTGGLPGFVQAELNGRVGWLPEKVVSELLVDEPSASPHALVAIPASSAPVDHADPFLSTPAPAPAAEPGKKKGKIARFFSRGKKDKKGSLHEVGLNLSEVQMDDIIIRMIEGIAVSAHRYQGVNVERSFLGSDAISWLISAGLAKTPKLATKLMKYLQERRVVQSPALKQSKGSDEFNERAPYCFNLVEWRESLVINADKLWAGMARPVDEVIASLNKDLWRVVSEYCATHSPDDLSPLASTHQVRKIGLRAAELQKVSVDLSPTDRLTFWVNLRNFVVLLGLIRYGQPTNIRDCQNFFNSIKVYVGFHRYTIQEIESMMILGTAKFPADDPRARFATIGKNSMVLLSLFDGIRSSPPFAYYTTRTFSDVLEEHLRPWLTKTILINKATHTLTLPKHLQRLSSQFGCSGLDILTILTPYLPSNVKRFLAEMQQATTPLNLAYSDYEWRSAFVKD